VRSITLIRVLPGCSCGLLGYALVELAKQKQFGIVQDVFFTRSNAYGVTKVYGAKFTLLLFMGDM
jgi:hypothetical protein